MTRVCEDCIRLGNRRWHMLCKSSWAGIHRSAATSILIVGSREEVEGNEYSNGIVAEALATLDSRAPVLAAWGVLLATFLWTYWSVLFHLVHVWATTPDMGHGFAVPIFAAYLLWHRQEMVNPWPSRGTLWCIPFFMVFAVFRWMILFLRCDRDIDSLFPFLIGMTLAIGGWKALRWAWPSILFLLFMVPPPDRVSKAMASVLQHGATVMSVYVLQTVGIPAIVRRNGSNEIDSVAAAAGSCPGVQRLANDDRVLCHVHRQLCFILREPLWKKIVLVVSAAPIAIVSNVARITLTGMLQEWVSVRAAAVSTRTWAC